jgi:hypothetical protein
MAHMGMRTECRHYESRTYGEGETVRKCRLDLAPEAPWRRPADVAALVLGRLDAAWLYGSLSGAMAPTPAPAPESLDDNAAALLDEAENIVNAAGAEVLAEFERKPKRRFRRKRR